MTRPIRVLHLEDNPRDAELIHDGLEGAGVSCDFVLVNSQDSFEAALSRESFDLIITDYNLQGYDGISALRRAQEQQPDAPVILISGSLGDEEAVKCLHTGATDYLLKDHLERLAPAVRRAIDEAEVLRGRKQAGEALLQSERDFRALFAANPLPMWIYDLKTLRFLEVNDAVVQNYGYTRDEFLAMMIKDIRPLEDVERLPTSVGQRTQTLERAGSWRHRVKSGQVIDVEITSHEMAFAGQSAALVVAQDVTERKRAEEEIRHRTTLADLTAVIGLSLANTDTLAHALQQCAEALVTHLGAAFARVWTLNEREGVLELQASAGLYTHLNGPHGRVPVGQFKIGRIALNRKAHLTNAVIGDPEVGDQEWARREGMVAFGGHPLIVDGRVVGVMALFAQHALSETVTAALASVADHIALGIERHQSAAALRTAEERMRFALQHADVGIWDMDFTTGALRWSETLEVQYGLRPGTFGGTFEAFVERIHPDDRASVLVTVGKAMKAGADFSVQNRTVWPDGTVRWLSGAGRVLLGEHGEPVRGVGISQDITKSKSAEGELRRLNEEIQLQRLRVFKATMRTVQDIVGNALMSLYMFRTEVESLASPGALLLFDETVHNTADKLKVLGDLDRVVESQMAMGAGIEIPTCGRRSDA